MVFNTTFNNILVISWWSVLLVEYMEKTTDLSQVTDKLYHIMLHRVHLAWVGFKLTTLVGIGTDCTSSCKCNFYTITTTMASIIKWITTRIFINLKETNGVSTISNLGKIFLFNGPHRSECLSLLPVKTSYYKTMSSIK